MYDTQFIDDIEVLSYELGLLKGSLVKILKRDFVEGMDYIYKKTKLTTPVGGRPRDVYMLTEQCRRQLEYKCYLTSRKELPTSPYLSYVRRYLPKETETLNFICTALSGVYTCAREQCFLGKYRVDLYFPDQRLVVECDEHDHEDRDQEYEKLRETELTEELGCKFVRYNPDAPDFCLAVLMSRILKALHE